MIRSVIQYETGRKAIRPRRFYCNMQIYIKKVRL